MRNFYWSDMILNEEKVIEAIDLTAKLCDELHEAYNEYVAILTGIKDEAIISGDAHYAIEDFVEMAKKLNDNNQILNVKNSVITAKDTFVYDYDDADKYLYGD